ncbi:MAG: hypothetical protein U0838_09455 [Chloroflexota bacterium]
MALIVLGLLLAPLGLAPAPNARAAATSLTVVTNTRYTVEPAKKRVRVVVDATIANHRADTKVNRYYFDHAFLAVQPGAASPAVAKGAKGASVKVASRSADATVLRINLQVTALRRQADAALPFNLADVGSGARRLIRVGTSLIPFPVWAYATAGASGSVRRPLPEGLRRDGRDGLVREPGQGDRQRDDPLDRRPRRSPQVLRVPLGAAARDVPQHVAHRGRHRRGRSRSR